MGYQVLRRYLESRIKEDFVDPQQLTNEADELRAYRLANLMKKICMEILEWVDKKCEMAVYLRRKEQGEIEKKEFKLE